MPHCIGLIPACCALLGRCLHGTTGGCWLQSQPACPCTSSSCKQQCQWLACTACSICSPIQTLHCTLAPLSWCFAVLLCRYFPPAAAVFGVCPLSLHEWFVVLALSAPVVLVDEVLKAVSRRCVLGGCCQCSVTLIPAVCCYCWTKIRRGKWAGGMKETSVLLAFRRRRLAAKASTSGGVPPRGMAGISVGAELHGTKLQ